MLPSASIPRPEHPRPDFIRNTFYNLNGKWQFEFDDDNKGLQYHWNLPEKTFSKEIIVPFAYQTKLSGIGPTDEIHPFLWYRRSFTIPEEMQGQRILLKFGAVDFKAAVFVNGQMVGSHCGGYTPFSLEISAALKEGENDLCVRVEDEPDCTQPRGKQYWERGLMGCWYTPVSGIWQTVYLEAVGEYDLQSIHITPDLDRHMMTAELALSHMPSCSLDYVIEVSYEGKLCRKVSVASSERTTRIPVDMITRGQLNPIHVWAPGSPALYDVKVSVRRGDTLCDEVKTYFGMRKVVCREGKIYLNNSPLYQRLILDQGYWPDSLITPPSDEAIHKDIQFTLDFGYNGARKHQKLEDPRYYYWADKMGLLVWGEVPSPYDFSDDSLRNLTQTLDGFIDRDFNHPCIITWVPLNESWGVGQIIADKRQQAAANMLYYMTKALDGSRLCSSNDGWEQTHTDICALHDYAADQKTLSRHFQSRCEVENQACDWRACFADGWKATGEEAFMVTEYGGIAFANIGMQQDMGGMATWGYHDKVTDEEAFFERYEGLTKAVREIPYCQGYCYTQLTDVMQEINGLLTPQREPKMDIRRFAAMNIDPEGITNQLF